MEAPETRFTLKDGSQVAMRSSVASDKQCILDAFDHLSDRSRYSRYQTPIKRLPDYYLDCLTHADNLNNVVLVAMPVEGDSPVGAGLARYVRLNDDPEVAEFSLTVIDEFQGKGLGSIMLEHLVRHARFNHVTVLRGYVLASNEPMISLLKRYNVTVGREGDATLRYDIDVTADVLTPA